MKKPKKPPPGRPAPKRAAVKATKRAAAPKPKARGKPKPLELPTRGTRTKKAKAKEPYRMTKKATEKPASEPEPVDEGSGQSPEPTAPAAAEASAGGLPDESADETAARDRAVRAQVEDFAENLPPGAESGLYSATAVDRWSNGPYQPDIPDGTYDVAEADWIVSFRAGRLYAATHRSCWIDTEPPAATRIGYPPDPR